MPQSSRSSSLRICSLSCFMSLDLSKMLEFTLEIHRHKHLWYQTVTDFDQIQFSNHSTMINVIFRKDTPQCICKPTLVQLQTNNKHNNMNKLNYFLVPVLKTPLDWASCWQTDCSPPPHHRSIFSEASTTHSIDKNTHTEQQNQSSHTTTEFIFTVAFNGVHI